MFGESLTYSFFTFRSHQHCKMPMQKEKVQSRKRNVCGQQTNFSAVILLNKIMMPIFQIIHIQKKKKLSTVERKRDVQNRLQRLCTFWHLKRSPGTRLHEVKTGRKKVGIMRLGENCPPENCPLKNCPQKIASQKIATYENCLQWKYPPMKVPPLKIAPLKISPRKLTPRKFPPMKVATIVVRNWELLPYCGDHGFRGSTGTYLIWYG